MRLGETDGSDDEEAVERRRRILGAGGGRDIDRGSWKARTGCVPGADHELEALGDGRTFTRAGRGEGGRAGGEDASATGRGESGGPGSLPPATPLNGAGDLVATVDIGGTAYIRRQGVLFCRNCDVPMEEGADGERDTNGNGGPGTGGDAAAGGGFPHCVVCGSPGASGAGEAQHFGHFSGVLSALGAMIQKEHEGGGPVRPLTGEQRALIQRELGRSGEMADTFTGPLTRQWRAFIRVFREIRPDVPIQWIIIALENG